MSANRAPAFSTHEPEEIARGERGLAGRAYGPIASRLALFVLPLLSAYAPNLAFAMAQRVPEPAIPVRLPPALATRILCQALATCDGVQEQLSRARPIQWNSRSQIFDPVSYHKDSPLNRGAHDCAPEDLFAWRHLPKALASLPTHMSASAGSAAISMIMRRPNARGATRSAALTLAATESLLARSDQEAAEYLAKQASSAMLHMLTLFGHPRNAAAGISAHEMRQDTATRQAWAQFGSVNPAIRDCIGTLDALCPSLGTAPDGSWAHEAVRQRKHNAIFGLATLGADINGRDSQDMRPIDLANRDRLALAARALIACGADLTGKAKRARKSAWELASRAIPANARNLDGGLQANLERHAIGAAADDGAALTDPSLLPDDPLAPAPSPQRARPRL